MMDKIDIKGIDTDKIKKIAEEYYRSGDFYCSEAVVKTIKDEFPSSVIDPVEQVSVNTNKSNELALVNYSNRLLRLTES